MYFEQKFSKYKTKQIIPISHIVIKYTMFLVTILLKYYITNNIYIYLVTKSRNNILVTTNKWIDRRTDGRTQRGYKLPKCMYI